MSEILKNIIELIQSDNQSEIKNYKNPQKKQISNLLSNFLILLHEQQNANEKYQLLTRKQGKT